MPYRTRMPRHASQQGFTLVEMLVVLCIVACLLAMLSPRIWPVVEKSRSVKTLANCKAVSDAFINYARLHGANPRPSTTYDITPLTQTTALDYENFLVPEFIKDVPQFDAWNYPFEYYYASGTPSPNLNTDRLFLIRSPGSNGVFEGPVYDVGEFAPNLQPGNSNFVSDDIVCADGEVIRWPGNWEQQ